jgi:3-oxoisoapionate decarboxylase
MALLAASPRLGIDAYSIRAYRWKALELIDYAARTGAQAIQIPLSELESTEPAHLEKIKQAAAARNIYVDAAGACFGEFAQQWRKAEGDPVSYLQRALRTARGFGATVLRTYAGSPADRTGRIPLEQQMEAALRALRGAKSVAEETGVKIALENHGEFTARETKLLIEEAGASFVGCTLDTGNPMWLLEDPLLTAEILAPHALCTHLRDSALYEHPRGAAFQWVALGDGSVPHLPIFRRILAAAPQAPLHLEIITGRPPQILPFHEESFWRPFRKIPAADFARFAALVKRGRPFEGSMVTAGAGNPPPEIDQALKLQQKNDLERSLAHARTLIAQL